MQSGSAPKHVSLQRAQAAFTLTEILTTAALSVVILGAVLKMLAAATNAVSMGKRQADVFTEGRAATELIRRDLGSCMTGKHRDMGPSAQGSKFGGLPAEDLGPFNQRYVLPFEHNRTRGTVFDHSGRTAIRTLKRAVMNSAITDTGHLHPNFDSLAFATHSHAGSPFGTEVSLVAYYCAFTHDCPFEASPASMKLFRHFRHGHYQDGSVESCYQPALEHQLQARAATVLSRLAATMAPRLDCGLRDNRDLPYLLMPVDRYRNRDGTFQEAMHIWPVDCVRLAEPPPTSMPAAPERYDATDPDRHRLSAAWLWPDDPLALNVVRFKATPLRRGPDGRYLEAALLNASHGINLEHPSQWPVILAPEMVEVEVQVISAETATKFTREEDWLHWETDPVLAGLVRRESRTFRIRVAIRGAGA